MVNALDTSALNPGALKTIRDNQVEMQLENQKINAGNLANASAGNIYATQVLSAATATGNQQTYDGAKAHLAAMGLDMSPWAADIKTGSEQANAARLAQSPLGSLLNAASRMDSNSNSATIAGGTVPADPNAHAHSLIRGALVQQYGEPAGALYDKHTAPAPAQGAASPGLSLPAGGGAPAPAPAAIPADGGGSALPQVSDIQGRDPGYMSNMPPSRSDKKYQDSSMTATQRNELYQADLNAWKELPSTKRAQKKEEKLGDTAAGNVEAANKAQELTDRLTKNLNAMLQLNDSTPQSGFIPASAKAYLSRGLQANGLGTGEDAQAYEQWNQIDNQQVLSEIQQFIAAGGANTRVNQTLERIAKAASHISAEGSPATRKSLITNALAELQNKNIGAKNLVNADEGNASQEYTNIPVTTPGFKPGQIFNSPSKGKVVFTGGDPTDENNYRKVK